MKEKEEFIRNMARMQLLNRKAVLILRKAIAKKMNEGRTYIFPADGQQQNNQI